MAHIVPSDISHVALAGARELELETLKTLRARLPGSYTVFHGVHWSREYRGYTVFGELDFVVVNQSGKALLIEQKNGLLDESEDGLVKTYAERPKNVADQVRRALEGVREKFKWVHGGHANLDLDYLIYCPDYRVANLSAAALDASRIVHAGSPDPISERIESVLGAGAPGREDWAEKVLAFFRQTFELVPDIHAHVSGQERSFTRLSGGLVKLLAGLEMDPLRLRVYGTAGCGKTMIARHFFDQAIEHDRRPLLVCFNRPLSERVKAIVRTGGLVTTFYGLCAQFLQERGQRLDFEEMKGDPHFWEKVADRVILESVPEAWKYDALIVDEGQDFEPIWVDILGLFLRPGNDILWLEDPDQNVRAQSAVTLSDFVRYRARTNYRSPESIARFIMRALPVRFECGNDLPGLGIGVTPYADASDQPPAVAKIITALLQKGFAHADIVILTTRHVTTPGAERSIFSTRERAGNYRLRQFTNEYDLFGNQVLTAGQIAFDSIARFKGQQAAAVILVDIDPTPGDREQMTKLLFSGMTRATVRLELLVKQGNPLNEGLLQTRTDAR